MQDFPPSVMNKVVRTFCASAVLIEPFYSAFLWQSLVETAEKAITTFGGSLDERAKAYIRYVAVPFAVINLISDLTSVDPLREADALTAPTKKQKKRIAFSKRALGFFIKTLAVTTSFPVGASADGLPISDFIAQFTQGVSGDILRYGGLSLVTILGVVYYAMFTNARIQRHTDEFIDTLKNLPDFFQRLLRHPAQYLEVWTQSLFNAAYRGISFWYILETVGQDIFKLDKHNPYLRSLTLATGLSTFGVTLFSRVLSTRDRFLNPAFDTLTEIELAQTSRLRAILFSDALLSFIRGSASGLLLFEFVPTALPLTLKYGISLSAAFLMTTHSFYVRCQSGYYENALKLKKLKQPETPSMISKTETVRLLLSETLDPVENAPKLFDQIAASHNSAGINFVIETVNLIARLTKFVAFFLFVETFNEIFLGSGLSSLGIIALVFLWGAEVFKNDGEVFSESLRSTWQGMAAKWQLEKAQEDTAKLSCCSGSFFRPLRVIAKSLYDYPSKLLEQETQKDLGQIQHGI